MVGKRAREICSGHVHSQCLCNALLVLNLLFILFRSRAPSFKLFFLARSVHTAIQACRELWAEQGNAEWCYVFFFCAVLLKCELAVLPCVLFLFRDALDPCQYPVLDTLFQDPWSKLLFTGDRSLFWRQCRIWNYMNAINARMYQWTKQVKKTIFSIYIVCTYLYDSVIHLIYLYSFVILYQSFMDLSSMHVSASCVYQNMYVFFPSHVKDVSRASLHAIR